MFEIFENLEIFEIFEIFKIFEIFDFFKKIPKKFKFWKKIYHFGNDYWKIVSKKIVSKNSWNFCPPGGTYKKKSKTNLDII